MPGLILAAPASGSGKTLIAAGLLRLLSRRGYQVAAAKAGPDYIDPTFHALACGKPCLNLDAWAMRPATLARLIDELEADADLVLCEGVMGLFDGAGADGETGSTAELARLTGWPVVLVVDAKGQGASAAALVAGFAGHDPQVPIAGVVFNRVGGARHRALLETALARHLPEVRVLGVVPQHAGLALPSRHLGLVPAAERAETEAVIERAAGLMGEAVDVEGLVAWARPSRRIADLPKPLMPGTWPGHRPKLEAERESGGKKGKEADWILMPLADRIAIACDDAFLFAYPALLADWRRQEAALSFFSPLADEAPDPSANAVFLPGGYPELHAGRLAAAERFLTGLHKAAGRGAAIYGECGGYMVLGEALTDAGGRVHRMAGLLPVETSFAGRRLHLGYRSVEAVADGPLGPAGARFRGHEFHYASVLAEGEGATLFRATDSAGRDLGAAGLCRGNVAGSFIHLIDRAEA